MKNPDKEKGYYTYDIDCVIEKTTKQYYRTIADFLNGSVRLRER